MRKFILLLVVIIPAFSIGQPNNSKLTSDDSAFLGKTKYRLVGPFRGGRSGTVAGDLRQKNTFYFGATGGGVWKTIDGGSNWKNISDKYFGGSIGTVAVAPSDQTVLYVGEGESTLRGNVSEGFGMWRSDDGGRSWRSIGLKDTRHIARIVIHPKDPDIVWVAAQGHLFGPNDERGVYKTTDGGKSWRRVLFSDNQSGAADLIMEPGNPAVLYATTWTVKRTPYSLESGGKGGGLWKSTDGGETWQTMNNKKGFPGKTLLGKINISVAASNPDRLYSMVESEKGGLLRSDDGGESWTVVSTDANIRQRSWYFNRVYVDPKNADIVYVLNVGFNKSIDGGRTFIRLNTPHGDHHDLWIDPEDGNRMIVADDGGGQISFNGGSNWSTYENQPTAQFYRVSTDNNFPYRILGAQQDNSTVRIFSRTEGSDINQTHWTSTAGFESGYVVADPLNPDIVYGGNYSGYLSRYDHKTGENRAVSVWPDNPLGGGVDGIKYRFQWNFPVFFSPNNPKRLYAAGNVLFASEDEGMSWTALSGDLTTNDKSKQVSSGGPITKDNSGVEVYCTIFTATESALEKDLLWTGSDDGLIHVSRDLGGKWENVTPPGAGSFMMWNCVETDPFKKGTAYFAGTKYKLDDFTPYIFMTEDYGKTWTKITDGIPSKSFTRAIRADRKKPGLLYCGTEYGMYISYNYGKTWAPFQLNLPMVPITDLALKNNDLIVATQGRAFWVLDDLTSVQERDPSIVTKNIYVYNIRESYRMGGFRNPNPVNAGTNASNGVVVNYYLRNTGDSASVNISVLDKDRKLIKNFNTSAPPTGNIGRIEATKGMNQFVWDMFYTPAERIEGQILWNGTPGGPKAPPGNYFVKIVSNKKDSIEAPFIIKPNPNYKQTQEQYQEQFDFLIAVRDKFSDVQKGIKNISEVRTQISDFMSRQGRDSANKPIKTLADSIVNKMTRIEEALYQTKAKSGQDVLNYPIRLNDKIAGIYGYAVSGNYAPTRQVRETFTYLSGQADAELAKLKMILTDEVPKLNALIRERALPVIGVKDSK